MQKICKTLQQKCLRYRETFLYLQWGNYSIIRFLITICENRYEFYIPNVDSVFHGQASIRYLGPPIWQLVPSEFKDLNTVSAFKAAIRKWKPNKCPCRLCKTYIGNVGFIWITCLVLTIDAEWIAGFVCLFSWWKGFLLAGG